MTKAYIIAPSILSADFGKLAEQIKEAEDAGADWLHIDVMDGHFVPNLTMGQFIVETCKGISELPLDVHLMVEQPEKMLKSFVEAGAHSLTVHVEAGAHVHRTLQTIKELGCRAGVALNPGTPASAVEPVLGLADLILVMTVNPGYSGQEFLWEVVPKIAQLAQMRDEPNSKAMIEVDGGISAETLPAAREAGAQVFVAASAVFRHPKGIAAGVQALKDKLPA
jgi:ribulose-phosphate 3-epimerase